MGFRDVICLLTLLLLLLLQMFGPDMPPLEWDPEQEYSRERVQLYYLSNAGQPLQQVRTFLGACGHACVAA
jgi:hypothetical protein